MENPFAYELYMFHRFCTSQKVTKIRRNVFSVVHAISQCSFTALMFLSKSHRMTETCLIGTLTMDDMLKVLSKFWLKRQNDVTTIF